MDGPVYKCENIKRSKCWWKGSVRGDVWIQDQNGEWTEVNAVGSFVYLEDKQSGIRVDTQFTQIGTGTVTTSVAVSARGKVIVANKGRIIINGKKLPKTKRSILLRFIGKEIKVRYSSKSKNTIVIRGLTEERIGLVFDTVTSTYTVNVAAEDTAKGLFTDPQNPAKYQLPKNKSKFNKYVAFKMLRSQHGTPEERKKGMECCHVLHSEEKMNECISDFIRTKSCFLHEFQNNTPDLIN